MKTLPALLDAHYSAGTTTLADLLKITRTDGEIYAFTSAAEDVTISGQVYTSAQGLNISSIEVAAGFAVDNLELTTLDDGTVFTKIEVLAGVWRNADFTISRYNWASPSDGVEVRMVGTVGEVHLHRGYVTAELRGLQQYLQQPIGSVSSKTCRARLGDARCTKDLTAFTHTGTVTSVTSRQVFQGSFAGDVPGDTDFASVSLLLHGDGVNGSTVFTDSSSNALTVTAAAGATISTGLSKFGGTSIVLGYIQLPAATQLDFPGDFTVEYFTSSGDLQNCHFYGGTGFYIYNDTLYVNDEPVISSLSLTGAAGIWKHIAVTRSGSTIRVFQDGVLKGTGTSALSVTLSSGHIGNYLPNNNLYIGGYIDEFRVTKGVARYTSAFTVPTAEFLDAAPVSIAASDYFADGVLTWVTGDNAGISQKIKSSDSEGHLTASLPFVGDVAIGDTYTITAGCRKRLEDCSTKFDNVLNFQGEPHLPGIDEVTR